MSLAKPIILGLTALTLGAFLLFHFSNYIDMYPQLNTTDVTMYMIIAIITTLLLTCMGFFYLFTGTLAWTLSLCILLLVMIVLIFFNTFYTWERQENTKRIIYIVFGSIFLLLIISIIVLAVMNIQSQPQAAVVKQRGILYTG